MSQFRISCISSARAFIGKAIDLLGECRIIKSGALVFGLLCSVASAAAAEYKVEVGDVIEILVARVPELQRRVPVKPDGCISFPLLGTLRVAGLSSAEVEANIQAALATRIFRQRTPDGRENAVAIEPDEVTAVVVQYRPIYVNGDVSRPGEQAFRPLMTARQAIALSGGYDILRLRMENPILLSADLRGEYESLWTEFARERARESRLKTELGENDTLDQKLLTDVPISPSRKAEIASVEAEHLQTDQADYEREKAFLQRSIKEGDEQIKVLSEQNSKEEQGAQADADELQRINELFGKGMVAGPRLTDARRALLLSSTRKLQTAAQLMQVRKQQDDIARQLERLGDQRRIKLLQDLQDAGTRLGQIRARLQSVGEKLLYTAARSQVVHGNELKPEIAVIRKGKSGLERIMVDQDADLQPGDVVEVALRLNEAVGKDKLAQTGGVASQPEPTATAAKAGNAPQERSANADARMGNATATAAGRAANATDIEPDRTTAGSTTAGMQALRDAASYWALSPGSANR